jgi:hypothetical protein
VLTATFAESNTTHTFTTNFAVNLPAILGTNIAYVGFTGGDGGVSSTQVVSNFVFVPITGITVEQTNAVPLILSWPATIGGYTMQSRSNLTFEVWQNVTNDVTQGGGRNQVDPSPLNGNRYFRLSIDLNE